MASDCPPLPTAEEYGVVCKKVYGCGALIADLAGIPTLGTGRLANWRPIQLGRIALFDSQ
jgi:hypothetical protein